MVGVMKRTPLILRGAIFRRERMVEIGDLDWTKINDVKSDIALYDSITGSVAIWNHPGARFVHLEPGESVIYTSENGTEVRYMQS